jgi:hypothetical protein
MHVSRGLLGWGVFFITLGSVPLAVRSGYLDPALVSRAWELWPLLLVGIGLGLILQRTWAAFVGALVVAITLGLMGGGLLSGGLPEAGGFTACGFGPNGGDGSSFAAQSGTLGADAQVDLSVDCANLRAIPADGSGWSVAGSSDRGLAPDVVASTDRLRVRSPQHRGFGGFRGAHMDVTLPRASRVGLGLSVNAGSATVDLALMRVPTLDISVNAADVHVLGADMLEAGSVSASVNAGSLAIALPIPNGSVRGNMSVNAGSIAVCVPDGAGLRIRVDKETLGSNNFGSRGLVRDGNTWTRPGYDTTAQRIELDTTANLGSITLNPEAGCG